MVHGDDIPDWLKDRVAKALRRYNCEDWDVAVALDFLGTDENDWGVRGECTTNYRYLQARIEFAEDLTVQEADTGLVMHEVGHVLFGEIARAALT